MRVFKSSLNLFISLLIIDIVFSSISFKVVSVLDYLRYILFDLGLSLVFSFITSNMSNKGRHIVNIALLFVLTIFSILQLQFKSFLDTFYTFKAVSNGTGAVKEFAGVFIKTIPAYYYLEFLGIVLYAALIKFNIRLDLFDIFKSLIISLMCFALCFASINLENKETSSAYLYRNNYDLVFKALGTNCFFFNDLYYLTQDNKEELTIEVHKEIDKEEIQEEVIEEIQEPIIEEKNNKREFDDTTWLAVMNNETDQTKKTIDEYLMSRPIEDKNEMTGIYEGKNFIYFMTEALDYIAIDEELTPTLYMMYKNGRSYVNHYTPIYACGTGDSEYVGMTGTYPLVSNCTLYDTELDSHQSLAELFKNAGYTVKSFHNWTDEFYPRSMFHLNYGFEEYMDYDGLGITPLEGWLSDLDLMKKALPNIINEDKFFTLMVTCAMHYPYDCNSTLGDRYLDLVDAVHPDYPIEIKRYLSKCIDFDKALEYLLTQLKETGKLENTIIGIYGDHAPKTIPLDTIIDCSKLMDRSVTYGQFKQPFIIYDPTGNPEVNQSVCGSLDNMPTIANMFNLDYDPRLYAGSDIYNGNTTVKFTNGDWLSNYGSYINGSFSALTSDIPENYVEKTNTDIVNIKKVNQAMNKSNYYKDRRFIISHAK